MTNQYKYTYQLPQSRVQGTVTLVFEIKRCYKRPNIDSGESGEGRHLMQKLKWKIVVDQFWFKKGRGFHQGAAESCERKNLCDQN